MKGPNLGSARAGLFSKDVGSGTLCRVHVAFGGAVFAFASALPVSVSIVACNGGRGAQVTTVRVERPQADAGHLDVVDGGPPESLEPTPSSRIGPSYQRCDVLHGRVFTCSGPADGPTVIEQGGTFRGCDVQNGRLVSCGGWASGIVPVFDGETFRACRVDDGRVIGCMGPFDGNAVLERGPPR